MTQFTATRDEATAAILGAVLLAGDVALDIINQQRIRPAHFIYDRDQTLYQGMLELAEADQPIDEITLAAQVQDRWPDARTTPQGTIAIYASAVPSIGNLRNYCEIAKTYAWFGQVEHAAYKAADAADRHDREGVLAAFASVDTTDQHEAPVDAATAFLDWYESPTRGIPLPFPKLTEAVGGGLQAGEVAIFGGWPGMGKTFFAKDTMLAAREVGARCHEYANEMSGPALTARLISSLCGIPAARIRNRELDKAEWSEVLGLLKNLPYETSPSAGWSVEDYCRDMRKHRWDLAVIDTVTNLPCKDTSEWDRACTMLADTAAQTGTALILLSQLNKERDTGQIKPPPTGRDLRNTGAWYMRARVVLFVHRDQYILEGTDLAMLKPDGHIRVEKATHGEPEIGFVNVTFNPKWLRFEDQDSYRRPLEVVA
jgi:replicative DNA helicase